MSASTSTAFTHRDPLRPNRSFGNGLGLLLSEQRCLRRTHPYALSVRGFSPFDSLRHRVQATRRERMANPPEVVSA
jgi:hypothetical protein